MKTYRRTDVYIAPPSLITSLGEGEWSASGPYRCSSGAVPVPTVQQTGWVPVAVWMLRRILPGTEQAHSLVAIPTELSGFHR
jgi:hypothetical protein